MEFKRIYHVTYTLNGVRKITESLFADTAYDADRIIREKHGNISVLKIRWANERAYWRQMGMMK